MSIYLHFSLKTFNRWMKKKKKKNYLPQKVLIEKKKLSRAKGVRSIDD